MLNYDLPEVETADDDFANLDVVGEPAEGFQGDNEMVPLAPFFSMLFGDTLETEEGRMAALVFLEENRQEVEQLFQEYVDSMSNRDLRSLL